MTAKPSPLSLQRNGLCRLLRPLPRRHARTGCRSHDALALQRLCAQAGSLSAVHTWHPGTRPAALDLAADNCRWLGLEIKHHLPESTDCATVEFVARYKVGGRAYRLHEVSRFVREEGRWFYVDGEFQD